jgi:hypothetical protein
VSADEPSADEPVPPATPAAQPSFARRPVWGWGVLALGLCFGSALGWELMGGFSMLAGEHRPLIRGQAIGPAIQVILDEPEYGIHEVAQLAPDGSYEVRVPRTARQPRITILGPEGSLTRSAPLQVEGLEDDAVLEAPDLALWSTPLRVRRIGDELRFDWAPITTGEAGFPQGLRLRYSLVVLHLLKTNGEEGERSFQSADPKAVLDMSEFTDPVLNYDLEGSEPVVVLRAFDANVSEEEGAWWRGAELQWTVGSEHVIPR